MFSIMYDEESIQNADLSCKNVAIFVTGDRMNPLLTCLYAGGLRGFAGTSLFTSKRFYITTPSYTLSNLPFVRAPLALQQLRIRLSK